MNIGEQIRKYRKEAGLSQKELGEKLGVTQQHIAQYENGKRIPKLETINSIAGALGIGVRRLYPEFSHDEWMKTETAKRAYTQYHAEQGIVSILSLLYGEIEQITKETDDGHDIYYRITIDGLKYRLTRYHIQFLIEYSKTIFPFLIDVLRNKKEMQEDTKKEED